MASFNKVILIGNLTRDPELKYTPKGTAACQIGMAVNRKWRNEQGQDQEEVTFLDVQSWGKQAEAISKYLRKGSPLFVEGRLKLEEWEKDGKKQSKLRVVLESFQFLGGAKQEGQQAPKAASAAPTASPDGPPPEDDDVPF
jgi:single-strand DNA-binding protein